MTDTTAPLESPVGEGRPDSEAHDEHGHGLTDLGYVKVALVLAALTAVEVAWSYLPFWDDEGGAKGLFEDGALIVMMFVKFGIVAAYFMHLKFDNKVLTRVFYAGLVLAFFVYIAALTTFSIWG